MTTDPPVSSPPTTIEPATTEPAKTEPAKAEPLTAEAIKFPEGFEADPKLTPQLLEIANKYSLSAEAANELVALHTNALKEGSERATQAWQDTVTQWENETKADKEIGGTNLEASLTEVKKLLSTHGSSELMDELNKTGLGSNVHLLKMFHKVAKELNEPGPVSGLPSAPARDAASTLYPNQGKA